MLYLPCPSLWLAFSCLKVFFDEKKFLILIKSNFINLWLGQLLSLLITVSNPLPSNYSFKAEAPEKQVFVSLKPCYHPVPTNELLNTLVSHFLNIQHIPPTVSFSQVVHIPGSSLRNIPPPKHSSFYQNVHLFILSTAV